MLLAPEEIITPQQAGTLPGLFTQRVSRTPGAVAYRFYDALNEIWSDISWADMEREVERWQMALRAEKLSPGDRVAIMARNSRFWVMFDQAALSMGLVVVPVYSEDRADNAEYILRHSGARLMLMGGQQWERMYPKIRHIKILKRVVTIAKTASPPDKRLVSLEEWLANGDRNLSKPVLSPGDLATIVYTSGTTGRPKGVMLSHRNILSNVYSCARTGFIDRSQGVFLSFLPLSHSFERTVGYYLPIMVGATVAHSRSIQDLPQDLLTIRPYGLISVPRIFERVYARIKEGLNRKSWLSRGIFELAVRVGWNRFEYSQGRARPGPLIFLWPLLKKMVADKLMASLGGNLKIAISGGAALSPEIARVFVGLGIPVYQGYGLTEASPVVSVNTRDRHIPASIGPPLPDVEVKIGEHDELLVRGDSVMMGYWQDQEATDQVKDKEGWLHTGDKARIQNGFIFITGRIKDIIVLANGEKVSPADMEMTIISDPVFDQILIIGESRPYLTALAVLNTSEWKNIARSAGLQENDINSEPARELLLKRIATGLHDFPGYAQVYQVTAVSEPWTEENDLMTSTLKLKRNKIVEKYQAEIEAMYEGHE